ncbi:capsule assembly Wzi family protein [Reichenbachiella ulvae]|uniref:Capsule assembly Wzi family protein n=1 Tax=Reichenbachiella ulvae TaxID=2980104 RepID=A0ABT3CT05_9BACT|nr:capsule assembly Wzi family protein [Reichenbachiella ulvae]MCV9386831.1 capsule assembly Wzi family protein [Reichenbachiella ulvae]
MTLNNTNIKRFQNKFILIFGLATSLSGSIFSQVLYPESEWLEYYRVLEIKNEKIENRINIFASIINQYDRDSLSWDIWSSQIPRNKNNKYISILPIRFANHYNSTYARGYNDGALWKGKGLTSSLQGGLTGKYGILEFTLAPIIFYSQNADFELAPIQGNNHIYNYQFRNQRIDYVQRYGDSSFTQIDWGQTEIRAVYKNMTIGISTQNMVWGPAQRNPIIMSNNAGGFPHFDIGTHKPINTKIGRIEAKVYYGVLNKSDYFSSDNQWNYRYWSGLNIGYNPSFLPSLYIGFNRAFYKKLDDFEASDLIVFIGKFDDTDGGANGNDEYDQLGSLTIRWKFEKVGFETYFEYGLNDYGSKLIDTEPEHGRGYTLGFSKYIDIKTNNVLKLTYEHTSVDKPKNYIYRFNNSWYSHSIVRQGYTQDGQIIGAGIGVGSTTDFFDAQYFFKKGRLNLTAQRIRFDDDYFYSNIQTFYNHDHEWTLESKYSRFIGDYMLGIDFGVCIRENQYFIENNNKTNIFVGLNLTRLFNQ